MTNTRKILAYVIGIMTIIGVLSMTALMIFEWIEYGDSVKITYMGCYDKYGHLIRGQVCEKVKQHPAFMIPVTMVIAGIGAIVTKAMLLMSEVW